MPLHLTLTGHEPRTLLIGGRRTAVWMPIVTLTETAPSPPEAESGAGAQAEGDPTPVAALGPLRRAPCHA